MLNFSRYRVLAALESWLILIVLLGQSAVLLSVIGIPAVAFG